jgi:hypothetical protein
MYWGTEKCLAPTEIMLGKIIAGYGACQTELRKQNAGLFTVHARGT